MARAASLTLPNLAKTEAICVMTHAYNNIAQESATHLHGRCSNILQDSDVMESIGKRLKALRTRTKLSVRDVARYLEFEVHSRYSYYEDRFKGEALPLPLAKKLAGLFGQYGVEAEEVLALAGLSPDEAKEQAQRVSFEPERTVRLFMEVQLPNEASLTRMFDAMLWTAGHEDSSGELARTLAVLLPSALAGTTGEFSGEALDPDFRPLRGARVPRQTRARPPRKQ